MLPLVEVVDAQIAGANDNGLRLALGHPADLEAGRVRERDSHAVVRGEGFYFDGFTVRAGHHGDATVGEHAVDIEKQNLDAARARFWDWGHRCWPCLR